MYPYDWNDNGLAGLNGALLLPMVIGVLLAKYLSSGIRYFFWKNYWWMTAISFMLYGSSISDNVGVALLAGFVGAWAGVLGSMAFDPKDFPASETGKVSHSTLDSKNLQAPTVPIRNISEKKATIAYLDKPVLKTGGAVISPTNSKDNTVWAPNLNFSLKRNVSAFGQAESTLATEVNSLKNISASYSSTESDLNYLNLNENIKNPNALTAIQSAHPSYRVFKSIPEYIDYRVDAEIKLLSVRDNTLWGGCWITGKNPDSRNYLYRKIRTLQIASYLKPLFITLTLQSLDGAVNSMNNMSSVEVQKAVSAIQPNSAAL